MSARRPIRVLIVDDSAFMRHVLAHGLSTDPDIAVVGVALDPYDAREKITTLDPDVLTLDVHMPRMDGLTFLEKLMRSHPLPVVMVSSLTQSGCEATLRALEIGAVDFVTKPARGLRDQVPELTEEVLAKVKAAAGARLRPRGPRAVGSARSGRAGAETLGAAQVTVVMGASTGGPEALRDVLGALSADAPGVVVVQHMPERFTRAFADRLDRLCAARVKEAEDGDVVLPGRVLIAPGNLQLRLVRDGVAVRVRLSGDEPVNRHRPSVDVLFHSAAEVLGSRAMGVLLTGMGDDGARGLLAMRRAGARTVAQDEASCVVFGMPREAIVLGAAERVLPLWQIAGVLQRAWSPALTLPPPATRSAVSE